MTAYDDAVLADAPLLYLRLDETSGTVAEDSSGNGHNATYSGGVSLNQTGLIPGTVCPTFDGVTAKVATDGTFRTEFANLTVECLFEGLAGGTPSNGNPLVFLAGSSLGGFNLQTDHVDFPTFATMGVESAAGDDVIANSPASSLMQDTAYHAVGVYDGATLTLYINGVSVATAAGAIVPAPNDVQPIYVGSDGGFAFGYGKISNVAVYPTALSAARVLAHYDASQSPGNLYTPPTLNDCGPVLFDTQGLPRALFRHYAARPRFQTVWKLATDPVTYSLTQPYPLITPADVAQGNVPIGQQYTDATYLHVYYGPETVDADEAARLVASGIGTVT